MVDNIEFTWDHSCFSSKLNELVNEKKTFFVFVYGAHGPDGKSWCPDCDVSQPFVKKAKEDIVYKNKDKGILFINLPVVRAERSDYTNDKVVKLTRIPALIFYLKGKEMTRIVEGDMASQESVSGFIEQAYE